MSVRTWKFESSSGHQILSSPFLRAVFSYLCLLCVIGKLIFLIAYSYFCFCYFNSFCFSVLHLQHGCLAELFKIGLHKHLKLENYFNRDLIAQKLIKRKLVRYFRFIVGSNE